MSIAVRDLFAPRNGAGRRRVSWGTDSAWSAGAGVLAVAAAWWVLRLTPADLGRRWTVGGDDGLLHAMLFDAATRAFSYADLQELGFPAGLNVFFSGQVDPSSALVIAALAAVLRSGPLVLSTFVLLGFFSSAVTATWFARALRLSRPVAAGVGIAFALAPYHFQRIGYGHFFIANTWAIPLIGVLVLMVLGGSLDPFAGWRRAASAARSSAGRSSAASRAPGRVRWVRFVRSALPAALLAIAVASTGAYFAAFGVIVLGGAWIVRAASALVAGRRAARGMLRPTLTTAGVVAAVGTAVALGGLGYGVRSHPYFASRLPGESELYGGKLVSLLVPWRGSDLPGAGKLLARVTADSMVLPTTEAPGTPFLAAIGLVVLVLALCVAGLLAGRRVTARGPFRALLDPRILRLAPVAVWTFLFYTVSGLGFLFAVLVGPEIRAWSRISIVLILFGLAAVGVLVDRLARGWRVRTVVGAVLVAVALVDQVSGASRAVETGATDDVAVRAFVERADAALPDDCGVVQLPIKSFPDSGTVGGLHDYDEALPFVADPGAHLRWGYGSVRGTSGWDDHWATVAASGDPAAFARAVRRSGACAVEVDVRAYSGQAAWQWRRQVAAVADPDEPIATTPDGVLRIYRVAR